MARCIFCLAEKAESAFTDEHVFPEAIAGRFIIQTVCKPCNDTLGHRIDHLLTDHRIVQAQRHLLKLPGKTGLIPNPFGRGVLKDDPTQEVIFKMDEGGDPEQLYRVPSVVRTKSADGKETVSIRVDKSDEATLPSIVNKILARAGHGPMSVEEIKKAQVAQRIDKPTMSMSMDIDIVQYKRAIMKIAYELACHWLGDAYPDDPTATAVRDCMLDFTSSDWPKKHVVRGSINFVGDDQLYPFWRDGTKAHIGFLLPDGTNITAYVRIFECIEGHVVVSSDRSRYPNFDGMFLSNHPTSGEVREVPFLHEVARLSG